MPRAKPNTITPREPIAPGQQFGHLTAIEFVERQARPGKRRTRYLKMWRFSCDCGRDTVVPEIYVRSGNSKSCGCRKLLGKFRHGQTVNRALSPEYRSWQAMKSRCLNPKSVGYCNYGGRGIAVTRRWVDSFEDFLADMGPRPSKQHSLDRYPDPNGNYEPDNCRWATAAEQARNKRRTRFVAVNGQKICLADACKLVGMDPGTIARRMTMGLTFDQAVGAPKLGRWTWRVTPKMVRAAAGVLVTCGVDADAAEMIAMHVLDAAAEASR